MNEFAAIIEMRRRRQSRQFGAYGNIFDQIGSAVRKTAAAIDPSSSRSIFGSSVAKVMKPIATYVVKPAIATSAAVLTGGLSVLGAEKLGNAQTRSVLGVRPTVTGFVEGAAVGAVIIAAPAIGAKAASLATTVGTGLAVKEITRMTGGSPSTAVPVGPATPVNPTAPSGSSMKGILAGAGIGFLGAGPVGALVGGVVGHFATKGAQS